MKKGLLIIFMSVSMFSLIVIAVPKMLEQRQMYQGIEALNKGENVQAIQVFEQLIENDQTDVRTQQLLLEAQKRHIIQTTYKIETAFQAGKIDEATILANDLLEKYCTSELKYLTDKAASIQYKAAY